MNDNFLLYKNIKEFSFEMMKYNNNIPRNLMYIRTNIQNVFDNSIRLVRYYIVNSGDTTRIRVKYLKDLIVELSMLDYYLECLYKFGVLGKNKFGIYANNLENIRKLACGVISSEKKSC